MADLIPRSFWSFPRLSPFWEEDEDWFSIPANVSGLSVSEDDDKVYVEASVPGLKSDDVEVTFHKGILWIKGKRKETEEDKKKKFYREASYDYSYRVAVPGNIDTGAEPESSYANGVVKVTFAKVPEEQPKKIPIKV